MLAYGALVSSSSKAISPNSHNQVFSSSPFFGQGRFAFNKKKKSRTADSYGVAAFAFMSLSFNMSLIFISLGGEEQLSVKGLKIMLLGQKR